MTNPTNQPCRQGVLRLRWHTPAPRRCRCTAYRWPHAQGDGACRWPALPLTRVIGARRARRDSRPRLRIPRAR